jgi:hypothetical protein
MHNLLTNGSLAIAAYALARSGDLAFTYAVAHSIIRCVIYSIVFIWLLIFVVLSVFGFI